MPISTRQVIRCQSIPSAGCNASAPGTVGIASLGAWPNGCARLAEVDHAALGSDSGLFLALRVARADRNDLAFDAVALADFEWQYGVSSCAALRWRRRCFKSQMR